MTSVSNDVLHPHFFLFTIRVVQHYVAISATPELVLLWLVFSKPTANVSHNSFASLHSTDIPVCTQLPVYNKYLSYRSRQTVLQGCLDMFKSERLELGDNIYRHYRSIFNQCDVTGQ